MSKTDELLSTVVANTQNVYNAGYDKMLDTFWEAIQLCGSRTDYQSLFSTNMNGDTAVGVDFKGFLFNPKYHFENVTNISRMLGNAGGILSVSEIIAPNCTDANYSMYRCWDLENIDAYIVPNTNNVAHSFTYDSKLKRIGRIDISGRTKTTEVFYGCYSLEEINFEGTINNSISFQWCPLNYASLISILNALKDYSEDTSGTTYTLTLSANNLSKLTDAELDIGRNKGWVIK